MIRNRHLLFLFSLLTSLPVIAQSDFDVLEARIIEIQSARDAGRVNMVQLAQQLHKPTED